MNFEQSESEQEKALTISEELFRELEEVINRLELEKDEDSLSYGENQKISVQGRTSLEQIREYDDEIDELEPLFSVLFRENFSKGSGQEKIRSFDFFKGNKVIKREMVLNQIPDSIKSARAIENIGVSADFNSLETSEKELQGLLKLLKTFL